MRSNIILTYFALITCIMMLSNCHQNTNNKKLGFTMAIDSELTILMRDMFTYYKGIKGDIQKDSLSEKVKIFQSIHQAVATSPEKSSSELYQSMASIYVKSAERLNQIGTDKKNTFNQMVDNCMSCHQQMCPGPMVRIKKLYIK